MPSSLNIDCNAFFFLNVVVVVVVVTATEKVGNQCVV